MSISNFTNLKKVFFKNLLPAALFAIVTATTVFSQYEAKWRHFTGSDMVNTFAFSGDTAWIASAGGLSLYSISQQAVLKYFNASNSDMGSNNVGAVAIGLNGQAWLTVNDASNTGGTGRLVLKYFDGTAFYPAASNLDSLNNTYSIINLNATPLGDLYFTEQVNFPYEPRLWKLSNGLLEQVPMPDTLTPTELMTVTDDGLVWVYFSESKMGSFDGSAWTIHDLEAVLNVPVTGWFSLKKGPNNSVYFDFETNNPSSDRRLLRYLNGQWEELLVWTDFPDYQIGTDGELYALEGGKLLRHDGDHYTEVLYFPPVGTTGYFLKYQFAPDGSVWTVFQPQWQSFTELYAMNGTAAQRIRFGNSPLPSNLITHAKIGADGEKIILSGLEAWRFDGTDWQQVQGVEIDAPNETRVLPDLKGNTWFIPTYSNQIQRLHNGDLSNFTIPGNQPGKTAFHPDNRLIYENSFVPNFQTIDSTGGISDTEFPRPTTSLYPPSMLFDSSGALWIYNVEWANNRPQKWDGTAWVDVPMPFQFSGGESALKYIDADQDVYFSGSNGQLAIFDQNDTVWTELYINDSDTLLHIGVGVAKDSKNNLWAVSEDGLYKFDGLEWTAHGDSLPSHRLNDFSIDKYDNLWVSTDNGLGIYNENGIKTLGGKEVYRLEGRVYFDANNDSLFTAGVDAPVSYQYVFVLPDSIQLLTDEMGRYGLNLLEGDYAIKITPPPHWNTLDGTNRLNISLDTANITNADFRLVPDSLFDDAELYLTGNVARCDRDVTYFLAFKNTGTTTLSGRVSVLPDALTPIWAAEPSLSFDTLSGKYLADLTGVLPFSLVQFKIQTHIPGVLFIDQPIDWKAWFYPDTLLPATDSTIFAQPVKCAYDPNDKLALSSGPTQDGLSLLADELLYTIRFQNTGNDTAFTVEIRDTLDTNLDWATLRVLQASHPMIPFFKQDGTIRFLFENILLPDSTANEPASHGFVQYAVRAKTGLPEPVSIENTAFIFFDSNPPIVTNTTENLLVEEFPIVDTVEGEEERENLLYIQPNPVGSNANIFLELPSMSSGRLAITDLTGREIWRKDVQGSCQPCEVPMGNMASGAYFAILVYEGGTESFLFVKN